MKLQLPAGQRNDQFFFLNMFYFSHNNPPPNLFLFCSSSYNLSALGLFILRTFFISSREAFIMASISEKCSSKAFLLALPTPGTPCKNEERLLLITKSLLKVIAKRWASSRT